ncbi:TraR/DksA C4-type zinc finger protein [Variovorax soli]|uniref:RNA polymerase-binding transcription factor DksA n=1 Tax=Variovorax soli TaxID=376815 RepID=A0ABU1NE73_9BURK|nr:TraR/DksA C4-type zinc finger protein [Variovorax soli]MDR6536721.1 RNA polymerase-binding transcription factor DksA [Variovorax soli]
MNHMTEEDLLSFIERLDIMKRWALGESARAEPEQDSPHDASQCNTGFAAVRVRRPTLQEIEEALQRISQGLYGLCSDCDRVIARERMLIAPAAIRCQACHPRTIQ